MRKFSIFIGIFGWLTFANIPLKPLFLVFTTSAPHRIRMFGVHLLSGEGEAVGEVLEGRGDVLLHGLHVLHLDITEHNRQQW